MQFKHRRASSSKCSSTGTTSTNYTAGSTDHPASSNDTKDSSNTSTIATRPSTNAKSDSSITPSGSTASGTTRTRTSSSAVRILYSNRSHRLQDTNRRQDTESSNLETVREAQLGLRASVLASWVLTPESNSKQLYSDTAQYFERLSWSTSINQYIGQLQNHNRGRDTSQVPNIYVPELESITGFVQCISMFGGIPYTRDTSDHV
jgi:hypothetical protein